MALIWFIQKTAEHLESPLRMAEEAFDKYERPSHLTWSDVGRTALLGITAGVPLCVYAAMMIGVEVFLTRTWPSLAVLHLPSATVAIVLAAFFIQHRSRRAKEHWRLKEELDKFRDNYRQD